MKDMGIAFYVSLMLIGLGISVLGGDPLSRISDVLNNETSLRFYANCFLDKGACSGDGRALKRLLPDFVATSCGKCSDRQKQMACKIIFTMQQPKYADLWSEFLIKYDPHNQYRVNLENFKQFCKQTLNIFK